MEGQGHADASHGHRLNSEHRLGPDDELNLNRGIQRQYGDTNRTTRMPTAVSEDLAEELTGPVTDLRLAGEVWLARYEDQHLDHLQNGVHSTGLCRDSGNRIQRRNSCTAGRLFHTQLRTDLSGGDEPAVDRRQLTRGVNQVTDPDGWDVRGHWRGHRWQIQPQIGQTL
jgi:hypothetical protein